MIGKKIKSFIDASGLKYFEVAKKLDISYQNLNRILNKDSIETRYLYQLAEILEIPVTAFFDKESDNMFPSTYISKQNETIIQLQKRISELEEQLEDKRIINRMLTDKDFHNNLADRNFNDYIKKHGIENFNLLDSELSSIQKEIDLISNDSTDVNKLIKIFLPYFSKQLIELWDKRRLNEQE